ncbi:hypothetical protein HGRIS_003933 [Hohenbuehelia grisea]|uniref:Enoyl reductase (ER) domain-containing protein n=1 Tax=Hohenbuehelia grisea TaxID=104357 RepID=A0ABR3JHG0_9AGAR
MALARPRHAWISQRCPELSATSADRRGMRCIVKNCGRLADGRVKTMRGLGIGTVLEAAPGSAFKPGDAVSGPFGWTEFAVMKEKDLEPLKLGPGIQVLDYLNTLGSSGLTAYFGLKDVGKIKAGETLLVSGAAGSVGAIVCQLGKKLGAKVYAIAGTPDKCEWLEKELGVVKAFNYKSPTFAKDLRAMGYLDVFFDNVGGEILDLALTRLNQGARIVMCGAISGYSRFLCRFSLLAY